MRRNYLVPLLSIVILAIAAISTTLGLGKKPLLGLDLQGGASVVLQAKGEYKSEAIDKAKEIIRSRVDGLGVAEPEITRQGNNIVISLPGVSDQQKALDLVGKTAELRFRPVLRQLNPDENVGDYDLAACHQLRRAGGTRELRPPHRPHRARRRRGPRDHLLRRVGTQHAARDRTADRRPDSSGGGQRSAATPDRADRPAPAAA